jgi:putative endonuclease
MPTYKKKYTYSKKTKYKKKTTTSTYKKKTTTSTYKNKSNAYTYSLNLKGGKKYVGYTTNIKKRLNQHFSGNGSKVTQECKPISINHIQKCRNVNTAKKAETIIYKKMSNYHGKNKVRGAGHTKRFSFG